MNKRRRKKWGPVHFKTLQPGFLIGQVERGRDASAFMMPPEVWAELMKRGFFGGVVFMPGITLQSLPDAELQKMGLQRISGRLVPASAGVTPPSLVRL